MMKNILVTGGNGQLGRSLPKIAREYSLYRFIFTDMPETDITDRTAIDNQIQAYDIDWLVNCAAYTQVDRAESEKDTARHINATGSKVLAEAALAHGIKLIHISTDYVFGSDENRNEPYMETDPTGPINVYGETKLEGENAIRITGCDAAVIRTSWLFSEFGGNFVKTMLNLSRQRSSINVVDDQYGCPTYATDLARAIMKLIETDIKGFEIFNFCNSGVTNWYGFACEIFRQAGIAIETTPVPHTSYLTAASRPSFSVLDTTKIRSLGVVTPDWKESLSECLAKLGEIKV